MQDSHELAALSGAVGDFYLSSDRESFSSSRSSSHKDDQEGEREIGTQTSLKSELNQIAKDIIFGEHSNKTKQGLHANGNGEHQEGEKESAQQQRDRSSSHSSSSPSSGGSSGDSEEFFVDNPHPQIIPPPVETGAVGEKHVIVMVGLPARGKTHMARRLARYLAFFHGARTKVFNVGEYRRLHMANKQVSSDFFDHKNDKNQELRASFAQLAMDDMMQFLFEDHTQQQIIKVESMDNMAGSLGGVGGGGSSHTHNQPGMAGIGHNQQKGVDSGKVAFFDATNTTKARRKWIYSQLEALPLKIIFIESICTDEATIEKNIWDSKVTLPDYEHLRKKRDKAYADFKQRIANYEKVYQKVDEDQYSWVKLINNGQKVVINRIHGFLPMKMVQFLTNIHAIPHSFYLSRHGQSEYNRHLKIGGDSDLTELGEQYALDLAKFAEEKICIDEQTGQPRPARLWTSSLVRTVQTARHIKHPKIKDPETGRDGWVQMDHRIYRNLDELYAGVCDGMTYEEIEQMYPDDFKRRNEDKFEYRYPRGESYLDILSRLDPLVMEMESYREPLLIVGHQAVLRLLYGYFTGKKREDCPRLSIPLNTVIKLTPRTYDCEEERICLSKLISEDDGQREPPSH